MLMLLNDQLCTRRNMLSKMPNYQDKCQYLQRSHLAVYIYWAWSSYHSKKCLPNSLISKNSIVRQKSCVYHNIDTIVLDTQLTAIEKQSLISPMASVKLSWRWARMLNRSITSSDATQWSSRAITFDGSSAFGKATFNERYLIRMVSAK